MRTEAEVAELHDSMPGQQHILRLDIAMDYLCMIDAQALSNSFNTLL